MSTVLEQKTRPFVGFRCAPCTQTALKTRSMKLQGAAAGWEGIDDVRNGVPLKEHGTQDLNT